MTLLVRERAPLRHTHEVETPSGRRYRWAPDEALPENVLNDWTASSTMPGGHEALSGTLPRKPGRDYPDLERLSTIRVRGASGQIIWEGRLQSSPRTSGDQFVISPQAVGEQAHLEDDKSAQMIYVARDLSRWTGPSVQRQLNLVTAATPPTGSAQPTPDSTTGAPALAQTSAGAWPVGALNEALYDAGAGNTIGSLYYAFKANGNINTADPNWNWITRLFVEDTLVTGDTSANLRAASGTGTLTAGASNRRYAILQLNWATNAGGAGVEYTVFWTVLAVYGNHGLTKRGTASATDAQGFYASDIVAHAVSTWAPKLAYTTGPGGTIEQSAFVIPHAAFLEPTTAAEIVKQATRFDLQDWAVWEGPTFYWHPRGARGKSWRARVGPAKLQETGPSADRLWNSVIVQYQDPTGATKTVGPPGSGADATDSTLVDTDPDNPCNRRGITRRAMLAMQTTTAAGAIQVGGRFLAEQKVLDRSGSATLVGHVMDDRGVLWPASHVRAGDTIVFTDAADTSERRIVKASYNDRDKSCAVDLDAPPDALGALLERLSVVLIPLGVN